MGFGVSANIFQAQMMDLMASLEFVQTYMDDLLIITRRTLDKHLQKMETVLTRLRDAGLKVNAAKSSFCAHEIEYLGYILTREGIKTHTFLGCAGLQFLISFLFLLYSGYYVVHVSPCFWHTSRIFSK
jgi:hypothetical protein